MRLFKILSNLYQAIQRMLTTNRRHSLRYLWLWTNFRTIQMELTHKLPLVRTSDKCTELYAILCLPPSSAQIIKCCQFFFVISFLLLLFQIWMIWHLWSYLQYPHLILMDQHKMIVIIVTCRRKIQHSAVCNIISAAWLNHFLTLLNLFRHQLENNSIQFLKKRFCVRIILW
jgi:hypothetical protein